LGVHPPERVYRPVLRGPHERPRGSPTLGKWRVHEGQQERWHSAAANKGMALLTHTTCRRHASLFSIGQRYRKPQQSDTLISGS
jgi:hypothetical protein